MFSKFFINRPIFATVVALIIIMAGLIGIKNLPIKEYPSITPPQIVVRAIYPGADAKTLAKTVAAPLEEAINGVDNMIYMSSTLSPNGVATINVFFKIGTDRNQAKVDVNNRVQLAMSKLPEAVRRQGISVDARSPDVLKFITFTSKNGVHDITFIHNYIKINVVDDLKRIPGVGDVIVFGDRDYSIRIWFDPQKLKFYNLSPSEVINIIREQNNQYTAGSLGAEPIKEKVPFRYSITTKGRFKTPEEFKNIIIRSNSDGSALRLKDIAKVTLGMESYNVKSSYNLKPMIGMGIFLSPGANALEVSEKVDKTLKELSKRFPKDLEYHVPYDITPFVKASIHEVLKTLYEAIILVVILIYIFLGNWRATLIPTLAIPVSVIGTFAGLYALGFSINLLTLFALVLAIGLVVDDAIVVIENIERNLHENKELSVKEATINAMKELTAPLIAIVLVLSAVFIPAALTQGFSGEFYKQFAITIIIAVMISGFTALTLTPALAALLLKREEKPPIWPIRKFNEFFNWITRKYTQAVKFTIKLGVFSLALYGILIYATIKINKMLPTGLVPTEDKGVLMLFKYNMPATSLKETDKTTLEVEKELLKYPLIEEAAGVSGLDLMTMAFKSDSSFMFAKLIPWDKRKDPNESSIAIARKLMGKFSTYKDALVLVFNPPPILGMSLTNGFEMWIEDRTGGDITKLAELTKKIVDAANKDPRLMMVRTTLNARTPMYYLTVDREKAKSMNVNVSDVFAALSSNLGKAYVNDFNLFSRVFHVNAEAFGDYRKALYNLKNIYVKSLNGNMIPVSELVKIKRIVDADVIQRFNLFNSAYVTGAASPGHTSGEAMDAIEEIAAKILPPGYTLAWAGTSYQEAKLKHSTNYTLIYAMIFVFLILAALYESWSIPISVILSVPFGLLGAALGIYLMRFMHLEADIYYQIALITLIGLSGKNAILIVEFAVERLKRGYNLLDATLEAAKLRFRPIVMTSLAFILGTLPLIFSSGAGANSRHILGVSVVFGMTFATLIGVLFIPFLFYVVMWIKQKLTKK